MGRVRRRCVGGWIAVASSAASRARAAARLRSWERYSDAAMTTVPSTSRPASASIALSLTGSVSEGDVARSQTSSTRESVVFTPCPPGPDERENRQRSSLSGTNTGPARMPSGDGGSGADMPTTTADPQPSTSELLQVPLDLTLGPLVDVAQVGVLFLPRPALAQQVPGLVELDLEVGEAGTVGVTQAFASVLGTEGLLLGHELVDVVENRAVPGRCACRLISHGPILPPDGGPGPASADGGLAHQQQPRTSTDSPGVPSTAPCTRLSVLRRGCRPPHALPDAPGGRTIEHRPEGSFEPNALRLEDKGNLVADPAARLAVGVYERSGKTVTKAGITMPIVKGSPPDETTLRTFRTLDLTSTKRTLTVRVPASTKPLRVIYSATGDASVRVTHLAFDGTDLAAFQGVGMDTMTVGQARPAMRRSRSTTRSPAERSR